MQKTDKVLRIKNLKDMLIKTKELYRGKVAYKIKVGKDQYTEFTHDEVREMIDGLRN